MPAEYEDKIIQFHSFVINAWKQDNLELSQRGNMGEVPLTFDVPSNKTVETRDAQTVSIKTSGHEKRHYTLDLSCCTVGTNLPPFLIFKSKSLPKEKLASGAYVHVHPKG